MVAESERAAWIAANRAPSTELSAEQERELRRIARGIQIRTVAEQKRGHA